MSAVAEWGEEPDEAGGDVDTTASPAAPAGRHVFGVDVGAEVSKAVGQAVRNEVRKQLAGIAAEAVATILNEDTVAALQARALHAADQAVQEELNADTDNAQRDLEADVDEEPERETFYGNVDEFVREFLVVTYRREISRQGSYKWDPRWWMHPEAVARLDALWRAWEHLRNDPATGMSVWWRDHADHHMGVLMSPDGPFRKSTGTIDLGEPLPYESPPPGLFPDVRTVAS